VDAVVKKRADKKALMIMVYNPISLGILKTPGEYGADIAIAEGQSLGNHQNFGGPYVGLFSVNEKLVRKIPGRISGVTKDSEGKQGFVLTLQTREQHIRRDKATSNICTNSGLLALAACIYLAALGKDGMRRVAEICLQKAHYLADKLVKIEGVKLVSDAPYFNEFTIRLPVTAESVIKNVSQSGVMAGIDLAASGYDNHLLIAVTEKRSRNELDRLVTLIEQSLKQG
jgi:glycine dehydrogenase subunit 1